MPRILVNTVTNSTNKRNVFINSAFDFWQRGNSFNLTGQETYTTDRFKTESGGSGISVNTTRETDVPTDEFLYSIKLTSTGTETSARIVQAIEAANIRQLIGKTVTFSCWVKSSNITSLTLAQWTPTNGLDDWGAATRITANTQQGSNEFLDVTTSWTRVSYTFTVPAAASDGFAISLATTAGSSQEFLTTGWMLHEGLQPIDFQRAGANIQDELAMCQRYYQDIRATTTAPLGYATRQTGAEYSVSIPIAASMRTTPTPGFISGSAAGDFRLTDDVGTTLVGLSLGGMRSASSTQMIIIFTTTASGGVSGIFRTQGLAGLTFDSEL